MKLDRNTNRGGHGKYALVNMRKLIPIIDQIEGSRLIVHSECVAAFELLVENGFITLGNETPGDQFFVMKYKDKFTGAGLRGYAMAAAEELKKIPKGKKKLSLSEYVAQMMDESHAAEKLGNRIPD